MNTYIDLGCYDGDSVEQFRNWRKIAFPDREDWQIYAFDPNPAFKERWDIVKDENTRFYQKAAWIEDAELELAIENSPTPLGSTIMPGKKKVWDNSQKIKVEAFHFPKYLEQFKDDFVVVKMDIEGAEFPILEKMIVDNTDRLVDWLMVEFHQGKVEEYTTQDKDDLLYRLRVRGVQAVEWH